MNAMNCLCFGLPEKQSAGDVWLPDAGLATSALCYSANAEGFREGKSSKTGELGMKTNSKNRFVICLLSALWVLWTVPSVQAQNFILSGQTAGVNKIDLGFLKGGTIFSVEMSGQISLGNEWNTWANGALVAAVGDTNYSYANVGCPSYPKAGGGDGTNHFAGGGANFDIESWSYGMAGAKTTDTSDPGAIRFGAAVGSFCASPQRSDWFYVGTSNVFTAPPGGAHFFLAVNDSYHQNNCGSYAGRLRIWYPPFLEITKNPCNTVLSWHMMGSNYVLETSSPLAQPLQWTAVTNTPVLVGDMLTVTVDCPPESSLFRLRQRDPAP
jgi:hypothetical protein